MSRPRRARILAGLGLAATAVTGLSQTAAAERPPALLVNGLGTYTVDASGTAVVTATGVFERNGGKARPVDIVATLAAADGTLPDPGSCEPATATVVVSGNRGPDIELTGTDEVCGLHLQPPFIVTHAYTARYDVVAGPGGLVGTDGFYEVRLADNGTAGVFAVDT